MQLTRVIRVYNMFTDKGRRRYSRDDVENPISTDLVGSRCLRFGDGTSKKKKLFTDEKLKFAEGVRNDRR